MEILIYLICSVLVLLCYIDLRYKEIQHKLILLLGCMTVGYGLYSGNILSWVICGLLIGIFSYYLWRKEVIGGADVKVMTVLAPALPLFGIANSLAIMAFFLIWFAIVALCYTYIWKAFMPDDNEIPFLPVITMAYILTWLFRFG